VPLGDGIPLEQGRQMEYTSKTLICHYWLLHRKNGCRYCIGLLHIITSTGDMVFRFVNIDDLESRKEGF